MTQEELIEKVARALGCSVKCDVPELCSCRIAISIALEEAAKVVNERLYLFDIGSPEEGPFTRQDRVCRETREQAAAAIRALIPSEERPQPSTLPAP